MSDGRRRLTRARVTILGTCLLVAYLTLAVGASWLSPWLDDRFQTQLGLAQAFHAESFDSPPLFRRIAREISLDFLAEQPGLPRRFFSVRWEGVWYVAETQTVDLYVGGDDRVVVSIDGQPVLERNVETGFHTESRSLTVGAGFHDLSITYEQYGGGYGINVQCVPAGNAPRPFDPETLFPVEPDARAVVVNERLRTLRALVPVIWIAPPGLLILFLSFPAIVRFGSRTARSTQWLAGASVFLVAFLGYLLNALHFEPLVFVRQQNVIFSADTWTTIGSMSSLTFRGHIRQHPLFSLVTSTIVQMVQLVSPLVLNRAILVTLAVIGAGNCTLAYVIFRRIVPSTGLACWFAALYGVLFANLALFSIPETYSLSTFMVLVYLLVAAGVRSPISSRSLAMLTLLAGLAGLFNPPLLSLAVIHLVVLFRDRSWRGAAAASIASLAATALMFMLANLIIFGPEFYLNYVGDNARYGSLRHFQEPSSIGIVICGLFLYSVIAPLDRLTHHLSVSDLGSYFDSVSGTVLVIAYVMFMLHALLRLRPRRDPLVLGLLVWLATMTVFYVYFNPAGVMLYTVQMLLPPLLFAAQEFSPITPAFNARYVLFAGFTCLLLLRNVSAVYAGIDIAR